MVVNYGTDKVRFLEPVRAGSAVRARVLLADASERGSGRMLFKTRITIEIKDNEKPALVAETLMLSITEVAP
jgi:acyl dehydratase